MMIERFAVAVAAITLAAPHSLADTDWIEPSPILKGLYNIDWEGGTLGEFLAGIDDRTEASFVVPGVANKIEVEPFKMGGIWPQESLDVLASLLPGFAYQSMGGHATVWQEDGTVKEVERPWNYVISISNELGDRAKQEAERFDLQFGGGPVSAFVRAIQEESGEKKIVVMPEASGEPVPPMELTNVTIADAVGLLDNLASVGVDSIEGVVIVRSQNSIFEQPTAGRAKIDSRAWTVEHLISNNMSSDDLLSAIDAAIGLAGGETRVRYHTETGLLMARGPVAELILIENVIDRAQETAVSRSNSDTGTKEKIRQLRAQLRDTEAELQQAKIRRDIKHDEMEAARVEYVEVEKFAKEGHVSESQLAQAKLEMQKIEADVQMADVRVNNLAAQLSDLVATLSELESRMR